MTRTYSALCGIILMSITVFLGLSLVSYCPADTFVGVYYPKNDVVANPCGVLGAIAAEYIFYYLGWGAYVLLLSMAIYTFFVIGRQEIDHYIVRAMGWWLGLIGILICFSLLFSSGGVSSLPYGPGGLFGAKITSLLTGQFAFGGSMIIGVSLIISGFLMCADNLFFAILTALIVNPVVKLYRQWMTAEPKSVDFIAGLVPAGAGGTAGIPAAVIPASSQKKRVDSKLVGQSGSVNPENNAGIKPEIKAEKSENNVVKPENSTAVNTDKQIINSGNAPVIQTDKGDNKGWFWNRVVKSKPENKPSEQIQLPDKPTSRAKPAAEPADEALVESLASSEAIEAPYELPPITLLEPPQPFNAEAYQAEILENSVLLESTMADFGVNVQVVDHQTGPVLTMYEIKRERGTRLNKITALADDLSVAMKSGGGVRVVAPLPGRDTIGIEIPNHNKKSVRLREVIEESLDRTKDMNIPVYLGCDVSGAPIFADLAKLPHLLIAGQTGSGKSVCLHSIIVSMLMTRSPEEVRMLMIDPKMVELSQYKSIPHLMHPVVTDMKKAEAILAWAVDKMEDRYSLLAKAGARHISQYNRMTQAEHIAKIKPQTEEELAKIPEKMPFIVIIADEMADMMMTAPKEVESHIMRLAQKSRAVGIHLILATQKPTRDVITGLIKSNLPARISFQVTCLIDSRVVLDVAGAERLLGSGDMLFLKPGTSSPVRGQGAFLDDNEIERVIRFVGKEDQVFEEDLVKWTEENDETNNSQEDMSSKDELYDAAVEIIINEGRGSTSLLQTKLSIGYGRATRLIEMMEQDRILGAHNGGKPREVLVDPETWEIMKRQKQAEKERAASKPIPHSSDAQDLYVSPSSAIIKPTECLVHSVIDVKSTSDTKADSIQTEKNRREVSESDKTASDQDEEQFDDNQADIPFQEDELEDDLTAQNWDLEQNDESEEESEEDDSELDDEMFSDELNEQADYDAVEADILDKISKSSRAYLEKNKG